MADRPDLVMEQGQQGLRVTNLRKSYKRRPVIRDVTMTLDRGEVVGRVVRVTGDGGHAVVEERR